MLFGNLKRTTASSGGCIRIAGLNAGIVLFEAKHLKQVLKLAHPGIRKSAFFIFISGFFIDHVHRIILYGLNFL